MQRVDPFVSTSSRHTQVTRTSSVHRRQSELSRDTSKMFVHPRGVSPTPQSIAAAATPTAAAVAAPASAVPVTRLRPAKPESTAAQKTRLRDKFGAVGLVVLILFAGTAVQTLFIGEMLIAVYAIYALTHHVASRTTFTLALIALVPIVVLHAIGKDSLLATNFAVYVLLLAFVGVITLAREVRQAKR